MCIYKTIPLRYFCQALRKTVETNAIALLWFYTNSSDLDALIYTLLRKWDKHTHAHTQPHSKVSPEILLRVIAKSCELFLCLSAPSFWQTAGSCFLLPNPSLSLCLFLYKNSGCRHFLGFLIIQLHFFILWPLQVCVCVLTLAILLEVCALVKLVVWVKSPSCLCSLFSVWRD